MMRDGPARGERVDRASAPAPTTLAPVRDSRGWAASVRHSWSALRSRFLYRALDAIVTADPEGLLHNAPQEGLRTSNFRRIQRLVRATHGLLPRSVSWIRRRLHHQRSLPFHADVREMVGYGAGSTVYRISSQRVGPSRDLVLKVFRQSIGQPLPVLLQQAGMLRERHRRVSEWYAGLSVSVPVDYVVLHGPLLDQPAVAGIQRFVDGDKRDFFELVESGGWSELVQAHPPLRAQFRCFVERTLAAFDMEDACLDLVGKDNLMVVMGDGDPRLQVIDFGVIDLADRRTSAPWLAEAATERVMLLLRLYEEVFSFAVRSASSTKEGGWHR